MKMQQDLPDGVNWVTAYADGQIWVNHRAYHSHLLITPTQVIADGIHTPAAQLDLEQLLSLLQQPPELLLLGCQHAPYSAMQPLMAKVYAKGIGFEMMRTEAACRTYNLLVSEGRHVAAALWQD
ncbi:Mth938-like domain-containing protein [Thiorhodospira sibirica]|uniref:Mth938-like domain-containing protein n=1 Tax=Thiorhodospira sibirica TaxID=154347 RepID=UPI00022C170F|nr:Mth938-like domain-containing protein [Thiorhodospira sibirica]